MLWNESTKIKGKANPEAQSANEKGTSKIKAKRESRRQLESAFSVQPICLQDFTFCRGVVGLGADLSAADPVLGPAYEGCLPRAE